MFKSLPTMRWQTACSALLFLAASRSALPGCSNEVPVTAEGTGATGGSGAAGGSGGMGGKAGGASMGASTGGAGAGDTPTAGGAGGTGEEGGMAGSAGEGGTAGTAGSGGASGQDGGAGNGGSAGNAAGSSGASGAAGCDAGLQLCQGACVPPTDKKCVGLTIAFADPVPYMDFDKTNPTGVTCGDFDGNGTVDMARSTVPAGALKPELCGILVNLGYGDGTFEKLPSKKLPLSACPSEITSADVNEDGKLDLVVSMDYFNPSIGRISVLLGNGDGTFGPELQLSVAPNPTITVGDVDGDGHVDIGVLGRTDGNLTLWKGAGDGTFKATVVGQSKAHMFARLLVADAGGPFPRRMIASSDGTSFGVAQDPMNGVVTMLTPGIALQKDGVQMVAVPTVPGSRDAVAVALIDSNQLAVFPPNESLAKPAISDVAGAYLPMAADINADGRSDLVLFTGTPVGVWVLCGDGMGSFTKCWTSTFPSPASSAWIGDINHDSLPDIVGADDGHGMVNVVLNVSH